MREVSKERLLGSRGFYQAIAVIKRLESEEMSLPCYFRASIQEYIGNNTRVLPGLNRMVVLR